MWPFYVALLESNAANKFPPVPIHRPITRKLAAQIASKQQQPAVEVTKPPVLVAPNRNGSEDCIIIDAEEYKAAGYSSVPMFVQHSEAMMEEIDRMVNSDMICISLLLIVFVDNH
ncbi:cyclin-B2-4-like [Nicotiana tabacum]|uniref:Cyclin-B2-4-like n=1 Tax=Nicotiana tabacum TaxID=4097 RepID=A0AC58TX72_TOBAC